MATWVIINNGSGEMQVGKDGLFFDLDSTGLADTVHAVQWDGSTGEVENKDASTGDITSNTAISSFSDYAFAETAWNTAYTTALNEAKQAAYDSVYAQAIANGDSDADAVAAGNAARDAVTSL
tara:strand:+ start:1120 stop:1488 length:369 start_codon:yes stop_codon:yes gene_type:complete